MNRRKALVSAVFGAAAITAPRAKAAARSTEVFLARWEKAKAFTLQVADAMPAESYDFKPTPEMRSYGELLQHLASNNVFYISRLNKGEIPESLRAPQKADKETTKKYMTDSFDFCAGVLRNATVDDLDKSYPGRPNTPPQTGWDWILHAFIHTSHHRGYSEVYLRVKGIVPPRYSV